MTNSENNANKDSEKVLVPVSEYEELKNQNQRMSSEIDELKQMVDWFKEQINLSKKEKFGQSSEKTEYTDQLNIFNEAEFYKDHESVDEETDVKSHKRKTRAKNLTSRLPDDLPVEIIEHKLSDDKKDCPKCGDELKMIGKEEVRTELVFIPASAKLHKHIRNVYGCSSCDKNDVSTPIVKADVPDAVIKGSFASAEAIAHIAAQKFVMGSPLYRQEQELIAKGINLSRQTMSNWLINVAENHLSPVYEKLKEDLKQREIIHSDDTELQVLKEPGKVATTKSFMWLYQTGDDGKYDIVLYEYQPDKKHKRPRDFLSGAHNYYLCCDGYQAYHSLPDDVTIVGCHAHLRRKFTDALAAVKEKPPGDKKKTIAGQGKEYCDRLFSIEHDIKNLSHEEKEKERNKRAKPILDEMFAWQEGINVKSESKIGKALTYLRNQWPYLTNYLKDGRLEISNNRAERSMKAFVINRKNFLFANTPSGANASAVIFSLIRTAKENGLDPFLYLTYVLKKSANSDVEIELLMPNDPDVIRLCSAKSTS